MAKLLVTAFFMCAFSHTSMAHHAFAADYEAGNEGTVTGTITEVMYKNPHARYYIEVVNDDGSTETWDLQTMNLMMLGRVGWKKDTLKVGDKIKVDGILGRNNSKRMSISTVEREDGLVISPLRGITKTNVELNADYSTAGGATDRAFESVASAITAGRYELDEAHAYINFSYSHMGLSNPQLQFAEFDAELILDGQDMANSTVNITIDAASIDSTVEELDTELRGEEFFDTANYPEILFESTAYQEISASTGKLTGNLSVLATTLPVTLDVTINTAAMNRMTRKEMIGFTATGIVHRSDYGLTAFDQFIGDDLSLVIQVEFAKAN
jgi:polyisoprenoid-binding protein YceI